MNSGRWAIRVGLLFAATAALLQGQQGGAQAGASGTVTLAATSKTVAVGNYWSQTPPVLRMHSGQTLVVDTLLTNSPTGLARMGVPDTEIADDLKETTKNFPADQKGPGTHILTGPVYIEEAQPGDTLAIHIEKIEGRIPYAYNSITTHGFFVKDFEGVRQFKIIPLDWKTMIAHFGPGIDIPMHPFFGSIGVAPTAELGKHSSVPPDQIGGNMDNKDLVVGTTLYLPVWVPGALLEIGDGHAGQGDGEVDGNTMETSLRGTLRLEVIKNTGLKYPRAETPTEYIAMGFDPDLTKAATLAGEQMIEFLVSQKGMTKQDAYQLCSVAADFHITELVDDNMGVHVLIKKALFVK